MLVQSIPIRLNLNVLKEVAQSRPAGYLEDVISQGTVDGAWLELTIDAHAALVLKYAPKPTPPSPPSLMTKVATLANAVTSEVSAIVAGEPPLTPDELSSRISLCHAPCDDFNEANNTCKLCGCYLPAKARFRSQNCPAGRWPTTQALNA